jgi:hypothetical protein
MVCFFHEKACKGTTKNANEQIFLKKMYFWTKKKCSYTVLSDRNFG